MKLARQLTISNGLTVNFFKHYRRYFGDYHKVKVEITCEVPILEEYFSSQEECDEAMAALGASTTLYRRSVEKMGVSSAELEATLESIIEDFTDHSLSYLASPEFPRRLIAKELAASSKVTAHRTYSG